MGEGKRRRRTHPQGALAAASFHRRAREMEAQKQVNGIGVGSPHSSLQALVSGPQTSPLPTEENTGDRNAV